MGKLKNPYERAEKVAGIIGWVLFWMFVGATVVLLLFVAAASWGWWAFLWVPVGIIGLAAFALLCAFIGVGVDAIQNRWRLAKYDYERKHRND